MSDTYNAVYAAAQQALRCDAHGAISNAASQAFDCSWIKSQAQDAVNTIHYEMTRPSVLFRPTLTFDGNQWIALYGPDLQVGVVGTGDSPAAAMDAFDKAWHTRKGGASNG